MPPKKVEQSNVQYVPFYVLPIFLNDSSQQSDAQKIIRNKPINIKKCIDKNKTIQILKQKGLSQHLTPEGQITSQGKKFICSNIKTVLQQFNIEVSRAPDPKAPQSKGPPPKKDSKKDSKKQQAPVQQSEQPTIQLNLQKKCNDFHFLLDIVQTPDQLRACIQNGLKIDAVMIIEQKNKKGSNIPNFNLLGKNYQQSQLLSSLNQTKIKQVPKMPKSMQQQQQHVSRSKAGKRLIKQLKKIKNERAQFSNLLITQIPFQKDLSHPQKNEMNFIHEAFTKLCSSSMQKQKYQQWIKNQVKKVPMIEPLKQIIKKQVPIQNQDKKGKKDANKQPEFQTVEQVIQTKYQSLPQNIKSNLKIYRQMNEIRNKQTKNVIKNILQNTLLSVEFQIGKNNAANLQVNPQTILKKMPIKPLAKVNYIESLKNNLRKLQSFSDNQLVYNLIHQTKKIQEKVNLGEIVHKDPSKKQSLELEYLVKKLTDFMVKQEPKLKWNFSDRIYRQKYNKSEVLSQIQKQLLRNPKIYEGLLQEDKIKLLCLAKINPPGRVLYNNSIFTDKAVPDFDNWLKKYKQNKQQNKVTQFYDYKYEDIGNLSIKRQQLTPTDNVLIIDQKISIGNEEYKINCLQKTNTLYGIKQVNQTNQFWLFNSNLNLNLNMFMKQHQYKKISKVLQKVKQQGSQQEKTIQTQVQTIEKHKRLQLWFRTQNFIISQTPYPTINWLNKRRSQYGQSRRQFGAKGEITCHMNDGSVQIYYLNGNTSTYRNNKWQKVINNEWIIDGQVQRKLQETQLTQGDKIIRIRQDSTIFIQYVNGNSLTILKDQTKILHKKKQNCYQIRTINKQLNQQIIVRIYIPTTKQTNIIGHGSAFSYLGFNNILQRSVDGYLYQTWHNKFNTHLYTQKYQYLNKIYEEQIILLYLQDASLIKVQNHQHITYIQGNYNHSSQAFRQKWNQAFTLQQSHQVGVYDVHLQQGYIKTKDAQSNSFKIHVEQQNQINIAVSFKITDQDKIVNNFGNGFHIPQQNFFLPVPQNSLPPRIFTFNSQTNQYFQYLTQDQVKQMEIQNQMDYVDQIKLQNKTIKQYTKQIKTNRKFQQDKKQITFSKVPTTNQIQMPGILLSASTRINMQIQNNPIKFKVIESIEWNKQFTNVNTIESNILKQREQRLKQFSVVAN